MADECCNAELVSLLRSEGHDVLYGMEFKPGALDKEILETAFAQKRILLTEDKDFGELVYRLNKPAFGIILLRIKVRERHLKWPRLKELLYRHSSKLESHFTVVESEKFRFRPL
jgi:predicted nuclease of predicted toxin-antitoxin system